MEQENPTSPTETNEKAGESSFTYNPNGTPFREKGPSVASSVAIAVLALLAIGVIGTGLVFWLASPSLHHYTPKSYDGLTTTNTSENTEKTPEPTETSLLDSLTRALCNGNYSALYQPDDESGIFQCENQAIYSVSSANSSSYGQYTRGFASYAGTTRDTLVDKYFPDTLYIYRNYEDSSTSIDLILLVAANSEQAVANQVAKPAYSFLTEYRQTHTKGSLRLFVFYNEALDTVKSARDYVILSGVAGIYGSLPGGPVKNDKYSFSSDNAAAISKIGADPSLYSSQTRDAIKNHRHIIMVVYDHQPLVDYDSFRTLLVNSFHK